MINNSRKIILIGNYLPDKQESMKLFMLMFYEAYQLKSLVVDVWHPVVFFGKKATTTNNGIGKWLSYIDKYLLFPMVLIGKRIQAKIEKQDVVYHICDHSNAPYVLFLPRDKTVISCHDVLAIRGALGFKDSYCPASLTGRILQEWILYSLLKAHKIAFVSEFTKNQFLELKQLKNKQDIGSVPTYKIIYNGFNANFSQLKEEEVKKVFDRYNIHFSTPYIFHVGSALSRKNRGLLIDMIYELGDSWNGVVCFAGQEIDSKLHSIINKYGLEDRVVSIVKPPHDLLVALYNGCQAFVFPSFTEGFGWPLIESQACGTPVITSSINPMMEVCGGAALYANPNDSSAFANAFKLLWNTTFHASMIEQGLKNCERFEKETKVNAYLDFYE
jgi:glycosyltransferase involved in cell wall biosynthesis